jgi:outer membrane murein-binding lipoprotein Lpp
MKFSFKPFSLVCLALGLVLTLVLSVGLRPAHAYDSVSIKLDQLEFQVRSLQTQVNQLQSANGSNSRASSSGYPVITEVPPAPGDLSSGAQFDNLATLVIEINQRVKAIEERVMGPVQ